MRCGDRSRFYVTALDELIIEASVGVDLKAVCEQMGRVPTWLPGAVLRADGYETEWYKKD